MKIAIRKDEDGVIQIDRYICENYEEDEVRSLDYEIIYIDDKYKEFEATDFNTDLTFNESKYLSRIRTIEINERIENLRRLREPLLIAFDKYKSNVNYGIEFEDETQRNIIIKWYNEIKNLNENYIVKEENIPDKIKYYL